MFTKSTVEFNPILCQYREYYHDQAEEVQQPLLHNTSEEHQKQLDKKITPQAVVQAYLSRYSVNSITCIETVIG